MLETIARVSGIKQEGDMLVPGKEISVSLA
jgi:hypothetical protein